MGRCNTLKPVSHVTLHQFYITIACKKVVHVVFKGKIYVYV